MTRRRRAWPGAVTDTPGRARATRLQALGMGQGLDAETPTRLHVRDWDGGVTVWRRVGPDFFEVEPPAEEGSP